MIEVEIIKFANKVCENEKAYNEVVKVCTDYEKQLTNAKKIIKKFFKYISRTELVTAMGEHNVIEAEKFIEE